MPGHAHNTPHKRRPWRLPLNHCVYSVTMLMQTVPRIKTYIAFLTLLAGLTAGALGASPESRVLVYTKNQVGKGLYVHNNIPASVTAIKKLGKENNFAVDVSDDPTVFTDQNLKRYKALIFDYTNNEIFDNEE